MLYLKSSYHTKYFLWTLLICKLLIYKLNITCFVPISNHLINSAASCTLAMNCQSVSKEEHMVTCQVYMALQHHNVLTTYHITSLQYKPVLCHHQLGTLISAVYAKNNLTGCMDVYNFSILS